MSLRIVDAPPRRGAAWVTQSIALFVRRPLGFSMLFLLFMVVAMILIALPYIGAILLLAALPLLTLGFATAAREALAGRPVHAGAMVEPFLGGMPERRRALVVLCIVFAAASALSMLVSEAVDGGSFERLQVLLGSSRDKATIDAIGELLSDPRLQAGIWLRVGLTALISVPFWQAPMLVWWQGQGTAQALFSSTVACWRNRWAFALYFLSWSAAVTLFGMASGLLMAVTGSNQWLALLALPAGLLFSTAFYISVYFTYLDCFAVAEAGVDESKDLPAP